MMVARFFQNEGNREIYLGDNGIGDEMGVKDKILTKHPAGKTGRNISKESYDTLKSAILSALKNKELTHTELFAELNRKLKNKFEGNISWYGETVKLDLEARKIIARTSSRPQTYRVK